VLDWPFYFPFGKSAPTNDLEKFSPYISEDGLHFSRVLWPSVLSLRPPKPEIMTLGLSSLYFTFLLIMISGVAMSCNSSPRPPKSRFPHYQNSDVWSPKEIDSCDSPLDPTVSAFLHIRSSRLSMLKTSCQHKLRIPKS
jgi:hypothetical protein